MDLYMLDIYLQWLIIPAVPLAIGLFAVLVLGRINEKAARIVYYIAFGLSLVVLLYGLWTNIWIAGWNSDEVLVKLLLLGELLVLGVQAVFLGIHRKNLKLRRILTLTLMATPIIFVPVMFIVGDLLGVEIVMD